MLIQRGNRVNQFRPLYFLLRRAGQLSTTLIGDVPNAMVFPASGLGDEKALTVTGNIKCIVIARARHDVQITRVE